MKHYIESIIQKPGSSKKDLHTELDIKINNLKNFLDDSNLKIEKNHSGFNIKDNSNGKPLLFTIDIIIKTFEDHYLMKYKTNIPTSQALHVLQRIKASLEEKLHPRQRPHKIPQIH